MRKLIAASIIMSLLGSSCQLSKEDVKPVKTSEAEQLLLKLKTVPEYGFMFGHHDDPVYGIGWDGDEGRSDVESVCGDYPASIWEEWKSMVTRLWTMFRLTESARK